jgi:hypothetical protein
MTINLHITLERERGLRVLSGRIFRACREMEVLADLRKGTVNNNTSDGGEVAPRHACTHITMNASVLHPVS